MKSKTYTKTLYREVVVFPESEYKAFKQSVKRAGVKKSRYIRLAVHRLNQDFQPEDKG